MFDRTVGEAYVLMRADGRLLKRDIQSLGKKMGQSYASGLQREMDAATRLTVRRFQQGIGKGIAEIDFSGFLKEFGSVDATVEGLATRMEELRGRGLITERQFEGFADAVLQWSDENRDRLAALDVAFDSTKINAMKKMRMEIAEAARVGDFSKMLKQFGSIEGVVANVSDELERMRENTQVSNTLYARTTTELRKWADEAVRVRQQEEAMSAELVHYGDVFDKRVKRQWSELADEIAKASLVGDFSALRAETESAADTTRRLTATLAAHRKEIVTTEAEYDNIVRTLARWQVAQEKIDTDTALTKLLDGVTRRRHPFVQALDDMDDKTLVFSTGLGRAFGKGSRNNFLNFVGSFVSGMTRLVTAVPTTLAKTVTGVATAFNDGFSAARAAGLTRFASAGKGIATIFAGKGGIAGAILGAAVAAIGFGKVLPAIASAISMFAANAISLVGSVGVGLVGALLAMGPAAVAAAAGVGVLAAAWNSWADSDAGKKVLDKQKKEFESFYKTLYPAVEQFNALFADAFLGLGERVRPGLLSLSNQLTDLFKTAGARSDLDAWGDSIQRMFGDLSDAAADFTAGLIAFFVPILPYAERLTGYIEDLAQRFSDWARSAEGQNSIAAFMERAWTAAKALWSLLGEVGSLIGTVFDVGADETGTNWIQGWADAIRDFNDYLSSSEGKQALKGWFADAKQFGEDVGGVLVRIGEIFKELDSPEGRKTATEIADAIKGIAGFAVDVASVADSVGRLIDDLVSFSPPAALLSFFQGDVPDISLGNIDNEAIEEQFDSMGRAIADWASETWESVKTWASDAGTAISEWATGAVEAIGTFVSESWTSISTWASDMGTSISDFFTETGESISTFFTELPERFRQWATDSWTAFTEAFIEGATGVMEALAVWLEELAVAIEEFDLSEFATGLAEGIGEALAGAWEAITTWFSDTREGIATWVQETWQSFLDWGAALPGIIAGALAVAWASAATWFAETIASIVAWGASTWATFTAWGEGVIQRIGDALAAIPGRIAAWASSTLASFNGWVASTLATLASWREGVVQRISDAISRMGAFLSALPGRVAAWLSSLPERLTAPFRTAWDRVNAIFSGMPGRLASAVGSVISAIAGRLSGVYSAIVSPFQRAWDAVQALVGRISSIRIPNPLAGVSSAVRGLLTAEGGVFSGGQVRIIGEAGPEAVVPLDRPLSMVNPRVRALSAIAQGKAGVTTTGGPSSQIVVQEGAVKVITQATSPGVISSMVMDDIADVLYAAVNG